MKTSHFIVAIAAMSLSGAALAQQPAAAPTPGAMAKMAHAAKAAMHRKTAAALGDPASATSAVAANSRAPVQHSAISIECSKKADAQNLHGAERKTFRNKCKHGD
jgi:hypothetical protein